MINKLKTLPKTQLVAFLAAILITIVSVVEIIRYGILAELATSLTMVTVYSLFAVCAWGAFFGRFPALDLIVCAATAIMTGFVNFFPIAVKNISPMILSGISGIGGVVGTVFSILEKTTPKKAMIPFLAVVFLVPGAFSLFWAGFTNAANNHQEVQIETWQVPDKFDAVPCSEEGKLEKVPYQTKAYATDKRDVSKAAYVYTPFGYDEGKQYDILYLMHGTGDDEAYWLSIHTWNKTMLDNLIHHKVIKPMIVVTPTFYVEDDCADDLDQLALNFYQELRQDLMPMIESKYSTFADGVAPEDFQASRNHRGFAGLSRGAVTTMHSALCKSLDYFSYFGTFSGSRTTVEEYRSTALSGEFKDYSIDYWFVASGAFDFAVNGQVEDYRAILKIDGRLKEGVNTSMVVAPMRYHSQGNWHIALYNFLQLAFPFNQVLS